MVNTIKDITNKLSILGEESLILFMLSCAERMVPNYLVFYNEVHYGDPSLLRIALDVVWSWFDTKNSVNIDLVALLNNIINITPNSEKHYPSTLCSYALNSSVSVYLTVNSIINPIESLTNAHEVAILSSETVDLYIKESLCYPPYSNSISNEYNDSILKHPLMQREIQRQLLDINYLIDGHIQISELKKCWSNIMVSNIGFSGN